MSPHRAPRSSGQTGSLGCPRTGPRAANTWALVLALLAGLLGAPRVASAEVPADVLIRRGVELRREGKNAEALELFREAHAAEPTPRARAQIALAEQALGLWIDAERDLVAALAALDDPWIRKNRASLEGALGVITSRLAFLDVTTTEAGATLWVNGTRTSTLPRARPLRVVAGELRLELAKPGFEGLRRTIEVSPGMTAREVMPLVPSRVAAVATASVASTMSLERPTPLDPPPRVEPRRAPLAGWAALGGGALLVATGVVGHVVYETNAAVWNDDARCLVGTATRDETCGAYGDRAEAARVAAIAGYGLGLAAVIVGAVVVLADDAPPEGPRLACAPEVSLGGSAGASASCRLTF